MNISTTVFNKKSNDNYKILLISFITFCILIGFHDKAFHIDDPFYIKAAEYITDHPFDPLGFDINWFGSYDKAYGIICNPPLVPYYLALTGSIFGWTESSLHIPFFAFSILLSIGLYKLSSRLCKTPFTATLLGISTPVFMLSCTNLMMDIPMLTFFTWGVYLWIKGISEDNNRLLSLSGLILAFAILSKYLGIAAVPMLFTYTLFHKKKLGTWLFFLFIPLFVFSLYLLIMKRLYNINLFSHSVSFSLDLISGQSGITRAITGLSFTGGCIITSFISLFFLWRKTSIAIWGLSWLFSVIALIKTPSTSVLGMITDSQWKFMICFQMGLFIIGGIHLLLLAFLELFEKKDSESFLLFTWIFGIFFFTAFINWSVNGRSILIMMPAAAILLTRRLTDKNSMKKLPRLIFIVTTSMIIALIITVSDYHWANTVKNAANDIYIRFKHSVDRTQFTGHWGFQHYMEKNGFKPVDFKNWHVQSGDIVIAPANNTNIVPMDIYPFKHIETLEKQGGKWTSTMNVLTGAGFYSSEFGPLPFVFCKTPPEYFDIYRVKLEPQENKKLLNE